ncbi:MAG: C-type lectin domain-containing protein [Kofleriaceae bacterium]
MRALLVVVVLASGCLRSTQFTCELDGDCGSGRCETNGFCSFADASCASGNRFGELSGSLANTCVDEVPADAGLDAPPDAPACPADYQAIAGAPNLYRLTATAASWQNRRDNCTDEGTYLAIPNDLAELTALVTLAAPATPIWVGVSDEATENTFVTVLGAPQTFLPFAPGEPNDQPGAADCLRATSAFQFADDRCSAAYRAICECGPP